MPSAPGGRGYYSPGNIGGSAYVVKPHEEPKPSPPEPRTVATVVELMDNNHMLVALGPGAPVDVEQLDGVRVGDRVFLDRQSVQPLQILRDEIPTGTIIIVERVHTHLVEANFLGQLRTFRSAAFPNLRVGERVVIDPSSTFVIGSMGMPPAKHVRPPAVSVSWDDVGGQDEAKEALREAIELPYAHPHLFKQYGKRASKGVMLWGPPGGGKCLGLGTPVLMHDGTIKRVEDVIVGDRLMGTDSTPRTVLELGRGRSPMYRVIPTKGDSWVCNDEHILTLAGTKERMGEIRDMTVKEYLSLTPSARWDWKLWRTGVEFPQSEQFVDPYFAGIFLGDGGVTHCEITTMDREVIDYCIALAPAYGLVCRVRDQPSQAKRVVLVQEQKFAKGVSGPTPNRLSDALRGFSVDGIKFIPRSYLIADHEQRMALLAGLLDSDGHLCTNGGFEIVTKSIPLRDGILFLARSLGFAAYSSEEQKGIKSLGFVGTYQRIKIAGDLDRIPTRVQRKRSPPRRQIKRVTVTGFELEPIGEGDYYGFVIDGDRRFLLGDFTVTHNTLMSKASATALARAHGKAATDGFIYVKGPELINSFIGRSEENVRNLFAAAREHKANHGYPALVFIDECDALLGARDRSAHTSLNATVVPQFLAEMDGLDDHAAMFILATNRPDMLDPAVVRDGRIDRRVKVTRPSRSDAAAIFKIHLRGRPLHRDTLEAVIARATDAMFADERVVRELGEGVEPVRLRDLASGALIAGVIERASTRAMRRDIQTSAKLASGIGADDVVWAIDAAQLVLRDTDVVEAIHELAEAARQRQNVIATVLAEAAPAGGVA